MPTVLAVDAGGVGCFSRLSSLFFFLILNRPNTVSKGR